MRNDGNRCILLDFSRSNTVKRKHIVKKKNVLGNIENFEEQEVDAGIQTFITSSLMTERIHASAEIFIKQRMCAVCAVCASDINQ